jgi:peptide/nickel transport system substrate-binding protein
MRGERINMATMTLDRIRGNALRAVAFVAIVMLAACGGSAQPTGRLRISDGSGDLTTLDPHLAMGASLDYISQLTAAYFIRYGHDGKPYPELLERIPSLANGDVSADGRTIVWHLRHGVRWSDGAPFDARDVAFTTRAILNPHNDEAQGTEGWNLIDRIGTPDRYTVTFHLKHRYGPLVQLAFASAGGGPCVLPQHLLASLPNIDTAPYNALPVGIGPFRVVAWRRGDAVEMEANPYYWRGKPKLAAVTFEAVPSRETLAQQMRSGEIDLWPNLPPTYASQLARTPNLIVRSRPGLRTTHLDFWLAPGALVDVSARRAIRLAIDRAEIVRTIERGQGLLTDRIVWPLAPVLRDDPATIAPDPARARALLDGDGWRVASDGVRFRGGRRLALRLAYQSGSPDLDTVVELIRTELRAVGVELDARTYQHALLFAPYADGGILATGRFDATIYSSTIVSLPDFASNFDCAQAPPNGENYTHWCDARVNALLADMRGSYDAAEIARDFARLDDIFVRDVPSIQLFVWKSSYARNDRLRGYDDNVLTQFDDVLDARV